jgi:co-chaperonin GroES (HSP10)
MGAADGASLIKIPDAAEIPAELRPSPPSGMIRPKLPEVNARHIPRVCGFRVLVLPVVPPQETESGIALASDTVRHLELTRSVGVVMGIGDLAWSEKRGYPSGYRPCEVGDWVVFHANSGQDTLIRAKSGEMARMKYLNDTDILAVPGDQECVSAHMVMV